MPNWVRNKITFRASENALNDLKQFMTSAESVFDFNKLIPCPEPLLKAEEGGRKEYAMKLSALRHQYGEEWKAEDEVREYVRLLKTNWPWLFARETLDSLVKLGDRYYSNLRTYGAATWYRWCIKNWGTKWNACEPKWISDDILEFDTAWSMPQPIYERLTEEFPDVAFTVEFADEDLGRNCGVVEASDGIASVEYYNDNLDFACGVWGLDADEIREEREEE